MRRALAQRGTPAAWSCQARSSGDLGPLLTRNARYILRGYYVVQIILIHETFLAHADSLNAIASALLFLIALAILRGPEAPNGETVVPARKKSRKKRAAKARR